MGYPVDVQEVQPGGDVGEPVAAQGNGGGHLQVGGAPGALVRHRRPLPLPAATRPPAVPLEHHHAPALALLQVGSGGPALRAASVNQGNDGVAEKRRIRT